ncbi:MAG TPA: DUF1996 domain-containing protein [Candidatus Dormibacteraeota bacterium]
MRISPRLTVAAVSVASLVAGAAGTVTAGSAGTSGGQFTVQCAYSHTLRDDSIVFPAKPGASHAHDFYGNVSTSAASTYASLLGAGTTCTSPDDTAGYWQPALLVNGTPVAANAERAYYANVTRGTIRAFPAGLRIIAGNSKASGPQPPSVFYWGCAHDENAGQLTSPPQCADQLRAHIIFPNCWDGVNLDSADHHSHMAYSSGGSCPADHPVALPRLTIAVGWNATPTPASVSLSSGPAYTMHADFLNSWRQGALESLVSRCLAAHLNCGEITAAEGPAGATATPRPAPRTPTAPPAAVTSGSAAASSVLAAASPGLAAASPGPAAPASAVGGAVAAGLGCPPAPLAATPRTPIPSCS